MASRPSASAYLKKAQGKAKSVTAAKKEEAAGPKVQSFGLADSLEASEPYQKGDVTPERFPNAISHTWVGHSAVSDIINSIDTAKEGIGSNKSDPKYIKAKQQNQQTEIDAHLGRARSYLSNHLAAHKQGDAETALASLNRALDHVHDAHNVLLQSSKYARSGDSSENIISLRNLPSTLGDISRGYVNHLKKQGSKGNVPGVTDNAMNIRSYIAGVDSPSFIKPSGLIQPKAPKAKKDPNAPQDPKLPRSTVPKKVIKSSIAKRNWRENEGIVNTERIVSPKSDTAGFRRSLAWKVVAPHWTRNNPGVAVPREHLDNPIAYIATNNANSANQKISIPRSLIDAHLTRSDAEDVKRIANVHNDAVDVVKPIERKNPDKSAAPAASVHIDEAPPVEEHGEEAFTEYKRPSGLNVHFEDGRNGSTMPTGRGF